MISKSQNGGMPILWNPDPRCEREIQIVGSNPHSRVGTSAERELYRLRKSDKPDFSSKILDLA
jgi:hypothetical protein